MAAEMKSRIRIMNKLPDDARLVESAVWEHRTLDEVHAAPLAMYITAVHYLSNIIRSNTDVVSTYQKAEVIAGLCLNVSRAFFHSLKMPMLASKWGSRSTRR